MFQRSSGPPEARLYAGVMRTMLGHFDNFSLTAIVLSAAVLLWGWLRSNSSLIDAHGPLRLAVCPDCGCAFLTTDLHDYCGPCFAGHKGALAA